jgi:hypothetical protein
VVIADAIVFSRRFESGKQSFSFLRTIRGKYGSIFTTFITKERKVVIVVIYIEIGISPHGFVSTEVEEKYTEFRYNGIRFTESSKFVSLYMRVRWKGKETILDSKDGIIVKTGKRPGIRVVIGMKRRQDYERRD